MKAKHDPGKLGGTLVQDESGAYQVEYLVVLILVALVTSIALATVAMPLVLYHESVRESVTATVP